MIRSLTLSRANTALLLLLALLGVGLTLLYNSSAVELSGAINLAPASWDLPQVAEARQTKTTVGLLRQTALHFSKMRGGESIGGFPGFEPPEEDKDYTRKIKEQNYTAQDLNDWVKEINNYLDQIAKKNPGKSLEKILQEQGLTQTQVIEFLDAVRDAQFTAKSMEEAGVSAQTIERIETLMKSLRIQPWNY